jgi:hypothetical protein
MPYVEIISRDGEFEIRPMSRESADSLEMQGGDVIYIEDDVYEAWVAHKRQHTVFKALWIQLQNARAERLTRIYGKKP